MKKALRIISAIVAPVPYPAAAGYHAVVGTALTWIAKGLPRDYAASTLLISLGLSLAIGAALTGATYLISQRVK